MKATPLPNPSAGIDAVRLTDGRFLLVYNPTATGRAKLDIAISADGKSWKRAVVLEDVDRRVFVSGNDPDARRPSARHLHVAPRADQARRDRSETVRVSEAGGSCRLKPEATRVCRFAFSYLPALAGSAQAADSEDRYWPSPARTATTADRSARR